MVGVLPRRLLATAASSPAAAHLLARSASSRTVERLLATAASSSAATRLLTTAATSSPSSARFLSTAASSPSTGYFISAAASSPASARVHATAASSSAATRLLTTAATSPVPARKMPILPPLASQGMIRDEVCSGIKDFMLLGNLTNPQAAAFFREKDPYRRLVGGNHGVDLSNITQSNFACLKLPEDDKGTEPNDIAEDEDEEEEEDPPFGEDSNNGSKDGRMGGNEISPPPPEHESKDGTGNGGKGSSPLDNYILYELSELRKEMRSNNWRQYKQTLRVEKKVDDFRRDIDDKIARVKHLLTEAALRCVIGILLLIMAIAKWAFPYLKGYIEELWDKKKDTLFGDLVGKKDPPVQKP